MIVAVCRTSGLDAIGDTLAALGGSEGFLSVELSGLDVTALAGWLTLATRQVPSNLADAYGIDCLDLRAIELVDEAERRGAPPYHPRMMTKL